MFATKRDYDGDATSMAKRVAGESCLQTECGACGTTDVDGYDLLHVEDQTGKRWGLCAECATCCFCHDGLDEAHCVEVTEGVLYVIAGTRSGHAVFACGGDPDAEFDHREACGAICDECGVVRPRALSFHHLPCHRVLCARHMDHQCDKCGPDATSSVRVIAAPIDTNVCRDVPHFLDERWVAIQLSNVASLADAYGADESVLVHFRDDSPCVKVSAGAGIRVAEAARAWRGDIAS